MTPPAKMTLRALTDLLCLMGLVLAWKVIS
jgi:hypothetical protein